MSISGDSLSDGTLNQGPWRCSCSESMNFSLGLYGPIVKLKKIGLIHCELKRFLLSTYAIWHCFDLLRSSHINVLKLKRIESFITRFVTYLEELTIAHIPFQFVLCLPTLRPHFYCTTLI